ncbi:hypothetical protein OAF43_01405 [bacterium]|nr:hypothetical protein [bacterium]
MLSPANPIDERGNTRTTISNGKPHSIKTGELNPHASKKLQVRTKMPRTKKAQRRVGGVVTGPGGTEELNLTHKINFFADFIYYVNKKNKLNSINVKINKR